MGIYYPDSDENVQTSIATMMASIDTAMEKLRIAVESVDAPDGISILGPGVSTATGAVPLIIDFTTGSINYDTGGYWNAGNPTRITLDPGWWFVYAKASCSPAAGSVRVFDFAIRSNNVNNVVQHQLPNTGGSGNTMIGGLYCKPDTTDYLWLEILYTGTSGGNASIFTPWLVAMRIGDL